MLKNISNLGSELKKETQKSIKGGCYAKPPPPERCSNITCPPGYCCGSDPYNCVLAGPHGNFCR